MDEVATPTDTPQALQRLEARIKYLISQRLVAALEIAQLKQENERLNGKLQSHSNLYNNQAED